MHFGDRLKELRNNFGFTQTQLADIGGISKTSQANYESGTRSPDVSYWQALFDLGMDVQYILTGFPTGYLGKINNGGSSDSTNEKLTHEQTVQLLWGYKEDSEENSLKDESNHYLVSAKYNDFELIHIYNVEASAGHGSLVDQEQICGELAFKRDWLTNKGLQASQCALIKARGDSMEPTIADGDLLLVDLSINSILDDAIYIVQLNAHLVVKRIQRRLHDALFILSDNPKYETQSLSAEQSKDVKVIGRVRWYGHEI